MKNKKMKDCVYVFDMDGTLVEFRNKKTNSIRVDLEKELKIDPSFFLRNQLDYVEDFKKFFKENEISYENVMIISMAPTTNFEHSKNVKIQEVLKMFPEIPLQNIMIGEWCHENNGENKVEIYSNFVGKINKNVILFDDEIRYLTSWEKHNGTAIHTSSIYRFLKEPESFLELETKKQIRTNKNTL
ncbi:MAG: hypothetical protein ACRC4M_02025 [Mycoplasma sp.]